MSGNRIVKIYCKSLGGEIDFVLPQTEYQSHKHKWIGEDDDIELLGTDGQVVFSRKISTVDSGSQ